MGLGKHTYDGGHDINTSSSTGHLALAFIFCWPLPPPGSLCNLYSVWNSCWCPLITIRSVRLRHWRLSVQDTLSGCQWNHKEWHRESEARTCRRPTASHCVTSRRNNVQEKKMYSEASQQQGEEVSLPAVVFSTRTATGRHKSTRGPHQTALLFHHYIFIITCIAFEAFMRTHIQPRSVCQRKVSFLY